MSNICLTYGLTYVTTWMSSPAPLDDEWDDGHVVPQRGIQLEEARWSGEVAFGLE